MVMANTIAWRFVLLWALISACIMTSVATSETSGSGKKKVLVLNSYHSGYKGSDDILRGFRDALLKALPDTELHIEYLDSKNFSGAEFDRKVVELLRFKYQRHHFDLIVSTDDYAFDILEKNRDGIFGGAPVVFCGTNSFDRSRLSGVRNMIGIDERPSFPDTLDLIFGIHADTRNIVVIHDNSITGQLNSREFRQAAGKFAGRANFTYLAGLRLDDLVSRVRELPPGSVIIYFASFVENGNGERISSGDALQAVAAASRAPIYGGWEFNLGKGIVGGRLINLHEHGSLAGTLAIRILKGESPTALTSLSPSPNQYMFDFAAMGRYGISERQLPPESILINKPPGFLMSHRVEILATISVVLFAGLITIFLQLVKSRTNLKLHSDELARRNDELQQALSNVRQLEGIIPICMYCKNIRDDKESWHQLETYISKHSEAMFSHGICPECLDRMKQDLEIPAR